ncbi:MAG: hypothetical protein R3A44_05160 [Caldilineaceae bacterium]
MTTITLNLPEPTLAQARQAALALQRPVEEIIADMLTAVMPSLADVPQDLQAELTNMTWLNNLDLWQIARGSMPSQQQERLGQISQVANERELSPNEEQELESLRDEYGRITLRKARAYALLSIRGGKPLLENM